MTSGRPDLASWPQRLLAAVIDGVLAFVACAVMLGLTQTQGGQGAAAFAAAGLLLFCAIYHAAGASNARASVGRTIAGIAVVALEGLGPVSAARASVRAFVRVLVVALAAFIGIGAQQAWLVVLPVLADLVLMSHTASRRSIADLAAGTVVVNAPVPQPHRAPAAPMYSATDREFGPRP